MAVQRLELLDPRSVQATGGKSAIDRLPDAALVRNQGVHHRAGGAGRGAQLAARGVEKIADPAPARAKLVRLLIHRREPQHIRQMIVGLRQVERFSGRPYPVEFGGQRPGRVRELPPAVEVTGGAVKILDTGIGKGGKLTGRLPASLASLLRIREVLVELRETLGRTGKIPIQRAQVLFARPDVARLRRRRQPRQHVLHRFGLLGEPLQFVLGVEHRRPPLMVRGGRILSGAVQRDRRRSGEEAILPPGLHLASQAVVRGHGSPDVHAQTVEERALAGHAAADDAGQIRAEVEAALRLAPVVRPEERGSARHRDGLEPRPAAHGDVGRVRNLAQAAVRFPFVRDAHPRVMGDEGLAQRLDPRAGELQPRVALADVVHGVGVAAVEERLAMRRHAFPQPRTLRYRIFGQLLVPELEAGHLAMLEELQHLRLLCTEQALLVLDMGGEHDVAPLAPAVWHLGRFPPMKLPEVAERLLCVPVGQLKLVAAPRRRPTHGEIERLEIAVASDFRVEQEQQVQPCPALLERRLEAGEHGEELVAERLSVVVDTVVPLLHDPPDRAGLGAVPGAGRMRRDPQHPHPPSHRALQEPPRTGGGRLLGRRRAVHAGGQFCPPSRMIVDRVDVQVRLEPSRPGDVPAPLDGILSHEGHHPGLPRYEITTGVWEPSRIARERRQGRHRRRCGRAGLAQIRVQIRVWIHCAHHRRPPSRTIRFRSLPTLAGMRRRRGADTRTRLARRCTARDP